MDEEQPGVFTILEEGQPLSTFPAPSDSYAARSLWVFFVENLRPGFEVMLVHGGIRLRLETGQSVPSELYERILSDREES